MQHTCSLATPIDHFMYQPLKRLLVLGLLLLLPACAQQSLRRTEPLPTTMRGHQLHGILADIHTLQPLDLRTLVQTLVESQVIFVGEEHYHPAIQDFELQLFRALAYQHSGRVALAMEFLERDNQQTVDAYLHKRIDYTTLHKHLKTSPSFQRYYAPLIRYARHAGLPVIAMNVPRRIARQVSHTGLQPTLQHLSAAERAYLPTPFPVMPTRYREYFLEAVTAYHPVHGEQATRLTQAAFLKDVTMATTLATFLRRHPDFTVLAIAGRFHVDYGIALPSLLAAQHAQVTMRRITTMTVAADHTVDLPDLQREAIADYIRFFPPASTYNTAGAYALMTRKMATDRKEESKARR